ncbi:MAG TPA: hypothetical protein VF203_05120 [Burkholderiales bacterium]
MSWMLFPNNPALSALVLFLIALPFLYAAREPVHGLFRAVVRGAAQPLRLASRWCLAAAEEMRRRNEVVLLAHGREEVTQAMQREFERVTAIVRRDLQGYPALQRRLLDELTQIEEDYQRCGEVPPPPPEWVKAVETMSKLKSSGDGLVQKVLENIADSVEDVYEKLISEYRRSYKERHKILESFQPFWRSLEQTLTRVGKNLTGLEESAQRIDAQMERYEQILARSDKVVHALTSSATTQFTISLLVVGIAVGGAFVNFWLIARPMAAMVGGGEYIAGGLEASHVAALVILLVEAAMGLFLLESLRITHLFPRIHNMHDRMRVRLAWASFAILFTLAGVEVALAVMRDLIVAADLELKRGLAGGAPVAPPEVSWVTNIPVAGQMILGFVLPFALAFVAIPLEYLINSARTVIGALLVAAVRALAVVLRLLSNVARHAATALAMAYDVVIFLPLMIERAIRSRQVPAASNTVELARHGGLRKTG